MRLIRASIRLLLACSLAWSWCDWPAAASPRQEEMDYGSLLSATYTLPAPADNVALKGIAVRLHVNVPNQPKDEGPIGGGLYSNRPRGDILGAEDQEVYKTQRWKFGGYRVNVPPGSYKLTLKFSDSWSTTKGKRVFDVLVQGKKVVDKLDIVDRVGKDHALDLTFDNVLVEDQLVIELVRHAGETSLGAIVIEGDGYTRKINCGGSAHLEFEADWKSGQSAANNDLAGVVFDSELLRYAAGWSGGFVQLRGVAFDGGHGVNPGISGTPIMGTRPLPGWSTTGSFADPRPLGPLPAVQGKYHGLFRYGDTVVFSYSIAGCRVLDMPGIEVWDKTRAITRTLNLSRSDEPLSIAVCDLEGAAGKILTAARAAVLEKGAEVTAAYAVGTPDGTTWKIDEHDRIVLRLPALDKPTQLKLLVWSGLQSDLTESVALLSRSPQPLDLAALTKGGPPRWPQTIETKGTRAGNDAAYVIDTIALPEDNPWHSWMRPGGFDFFSDGRAALCTWSGDVWIASGIGPDLQHVRWRRFAAGLYQPLGLKIVKDHVYVLGRDQITLLRDTNNNGEADSYENFNNDCQVTLSFHEFAFDLQTDTLGNFYYLKSGPVRPGGRGWDRVSAHHGCLLRLPPDGSRLDVYARGFRSPNGLCIGPQDEITCSDNEGTWVPTTPINWIREGGFYGVKDLMPRGAKTAERDAPLCWIPHSVDNSGGAQVWTAGERFGPLSHSLLHMSYGQCQLFSVLRQQVGDQMQGGVFALPLHFESGIMRARFRENDNALYLTGLRGWQTSATRDAGFYRLRYTGKSINMPVALNVAAKGIEIKFAEPLEESSAVDVNNYSVQQWNYQWSENFGSKHYRASDAKKEGQDEVEIDAAVLSADRRTVLLEIDDLKPVMQMKIHLTLTSAHDTPVKYDLYSTINAIEGKPANEPAPIEAVEPKTENDKNQK